MLPVKARREFLHLIDMMGMPGRGGHRNIGRLRMSRFIETHGKDACDQYYRHHFKEEPQ